jgi:hypothetical protein
MSYSDGNPDDPEFAFRSPEELEMLSLGINNLISDQGLRISAETVNPIITLAELDPLEVRDLPIISTLSPEDIKDILVSGQLPERQLIFDGISYRSDLDSVQTYLRGLRDRLADAIKEADLAEVD